MGRRFVYGIRKRNPKGGKREAEGRGPHGTERTRNKLNIKKSRLGLTGGERLT